jgi:hypothetical protein
MQCGIEAAQAVMLINRSLEKVEPDLESWLSTIPKLKWPPGIQRNFSLRAWFGHERPRRELHVDRNEA